MPKCLRSVFTTNLMYQLASVASLLKDNIQILLRKHWHAWYNQYCDHIHPDMVAHEADHFELFARLWFTLSLKPELIETALMSVLNALCAHELSPGSWDISDYTMVVWIVHCLIMSIYVWLIIPGQLLFFPL